jgi:hypothetical protein
MGRPFIFAFEDQCGILPVHNVGVSATGRIPSSIFGLHYVAEIGNGRASRSRLDEPVQNVIDENNHKAVNFAIISRPDRLAGLQTGFSIYHDVLEPQGLPKTAEDIMAAHVVYTTNRFELLNEAILIRHSLDGTPIAYHSPAFYTQLSHRWGMVRPYFRYQYFNTANQEPIFGDLGRINGPSVGLRFDPSEFGAFKVEYDRTERRNLPATNGVGLQLAFTF